MASDTDNEEAANLRSQTPPSPSPITNNVLQPEKDFILTFKTLTELWDTTNPHYTNKYKRNENLAKLLPILQRVKPNATLEDVKKKINTIRSNYRRELKKISISRSSGAAADKVYTPKIWSFPHLDFLGRIEQLEESEHQRQEQTASETEKNTEQSAQQLRERRIFSSISSDPKPSVSSTSKNKKKLNHNELLEHACQCFKKRCTNTHQQVNFPNPIALEWSNTLDRLDPVQRLYAKKAINDILFEAELGNLNRISVRHSVRHPLDAHASDSKFHQS